MSGHTPGPWSVWTMGQTLVVSCTSGPGKRHPNEGMHVASLQLCGVPDNAEWANPIIQSNARLIAAAPELLAAAEWVLKYVGTFAHSGAPLVVEALEVAIAKAVQP